MDFIFLGYKDPLFSFIIFFALIFIIAVSNYSWSSIKRNKNITIVKRFMRKFGTPNKDMTTNIDHLLLIKSYISHMMYQDALNKIIKLLKYKNNNYEELLECMSICYLELGLLVKSKNVCIELLKLNSKNIVILKRLFYIYTKISDFKSMKDIVNVLNSMNEDISKFQIYIEYLQMKKNKIVDLSEIESKLNQTISKNKTIFICESCTQISWIKSDICSKCYNVGTYKLMIMQ